MNDPTSPADGASHSLSAQSASWLDEFVGSGVMVELVASDDRVRAAARPRLGSQHSAVAAAPGVELQQLPFDLGVRVVGNDRVAAHQLLEIDFPSDVELVDLHPLRLAVLLAVRDRSPRISCSTTLPSSRPRRIHGHDRGRRRRDRHRAGGRTGRSWAGSPTDRRPASGRSSWSGCGFRLTPKCSQPLVGYAPPKAERPSTRRRSRTA